MNFKKMLLLLSVFFSVSANAAFTYCNLATPEDGCAPGQFICAMAGWIGPNTPFCSDTNVGRRPTRFNPSFVETQSDEAGSLCSGEIPDCIKACLRTTICTDASYIKCDLICGGW